MLWGGKELSGVNQFLTIALNSLFHAGAGTTCFMLITGYFGAKISPYRLVRLWLIVEICSLATTTFSIFINDGSVLALAKAAIPITTKKYWYARDNVAQKLTGAFPNLLGKKEIKTIALYYYHLTIGGVQRVISLLIPLLQKMGYKVVLITDKEPSENDLALEYCVERVTIFDYQKTSLIAFHSARVLQYHRYPYEQSTYSCSP